MAVQNVVEKLFPQAQAQAPWVAQMSARGGIPVPYFIRLAWRKRFVGETFIGTPIQIGQLKDTYLEYQMDWRTDPYLRANIRDI